MLEERSEMQIFRPVVHYMKLFSIFQTDYLKKLIKKQ